jgi:hypothetical protein
MPLDSQLSSVLSNVWENRQWILYAQPQRAGETVQDRVYSFYAPEYEIDQIGITKQDYQALLSALPAPHNRTRWSMYWQDAFRVGKNLNPPMSMDIVLRLYINIKAVHAIPVFRRLMEMASDPLPVGGPAPMMHHNIPESVKFSGAMDRMRRHIYTDVIVAAKLANGEQMFSGRRDKFVIYLNKYAGESGAQLLVQELMGMGRFYERDTVPMTKELAPGFGIGAEVHDGQSSVGTSFGGVRCNLIAKALVRTVLGRDLSDTEVKNGVALPLAPPRTPNLQHNRLTFVNLVQTYFATNGIGATAPWN